MTPQETKELLEWEDETRAAKEHYANGGEVEYYNYVENKWLPGVTHAWHFPEKYRIAKEPPPEQFRPFTQEDMIEILKQGKPVWMKRGTSAHELLRAFSNEGLFFGIYDLLNWGYLFETEFFWSTDLVKWERFRVKVKK